MTSLTELSTILSGQSRAEIVTHIVISPPVYVGPGLVKVECGHSVTSSLSPLPLPVSIICIDWTPTIYHHHHHHHTTTPLSRIAWSISILIVFTSMSVQWTQHDNVRHSAVENRSVLYCWDVWVFWDDISADAQSAVRPQSGWWRSGPGGGGRWSREEEMCPDSTTRSCHCCTLHCCTALLDTVQPAVFSWSDCPT